MGEVVQEAGRDRVDIWLVIFLRGGGARALPLSTASNAPLNED